MPIDLLALATTTVTAFLAPYAKVGLEKIATAFTEQLGKQTADYAGALTGKLWTLITDAFSTPEEKPALELFRKNPNEMQAMLIKMLHEKLTKDATLAQTLDKLINQPGPDGATTGAQIMHAGIVGLADLRGANLSNAQGMTIAGVVMGDPLTPKPKIDG